jgi:hypothetical protein
MVKIPNSQRIAGIRNIGGIGRHKCGGGRAEHVGMAAIRRIMPAVLRSASPAVDPTTRRARRLNAKKDGMSASDLAFIPAHYFTFDVSLSVQMQAAPPVEAI